MYKYVLNSAVKISMMFAKYFEYYTIILGGVSWTRCITCFRVTVSALLSVVVPAH